VLVVGLVPRALQAIRRDEHKKADGIRMILQQVSGHLEMAWHLYRWGVTVAVVVLEALVDLVAEHRNEDFVVLSCDGGTLRLGERPRSVQIDSRSTDRHYLLGSRRCP